MATVNTRIESLKVDGQTMTAKFSSTNTRNPLYEVKLDGWNNWKEVANPATFEDLKPGVRTLQVRSYNRRGDPDPTPASREFVIEGAEQPEPLPPEPQPVPDDKFELVKRLVTPGDWNSTLIEGFKGASVQAIANERIRYSLPGPQTASGGRVETQCYFGKEGELSGYQYPFMIPSSTRLSEHYKGSPKNIISQHHGDKNAGYTGGVSVYPNGDISLRVKGGKEFSMSGSHPYEYEAELPFGKFARDKWHTVRLEILWKRAGGFARARLDQGAWASLNNVPTWPLGDSDGVPTQQIMYRHGWYPQGGIVEGDMDIEFGPLELLRG